MHIARRIDEFFQKLPLDREHNEELKLLREALQYIKDEDLHVANLLRGFLWMLDEDVLVRSTLHDHEPDFFSRNLKFVMWLSDVFRATEREGT